MKKIKKILAAVMTLAMVLGMSMTTMAAETASLTVNGLADTGTNSVKYVKILEPDVTVTNSGYKFVTGVSLDGYTDAKAFLDASDTEKQEALLDASLPAGTTVPATGNTCTVNNLSAGYYAVFVTNTPAEGDPEVVYNNPMLVGIEYENATLGADGNYTYDAVNGSVVAKFTTIPVTKEADDEDDIVSIGSTQGYTIETYIPSQATSYTITDTLSGALYDTDSVEVSIEGFDDVTIPEENIVIVQPSGTTDGTMTITLPTTYLADQYVGHKLTITYDVTVTGSKVENHVVPTVPDHTYTPVTEYLGTGAIELTKTGEDSVGLPNAVFNVKDEDGNVLKFTLNETDGLYYLDPENGEENVTTGTGGILTVIGLDLGTYTFEEVQAPEGYSINGNDVTATINVENTTTHESYAPAETSMEDTKLAELPSTGGIGTTIFTVGGCIIMIAAAGLFFASRRKSSK